MLLFFHCWSPAAPDDPGAACDLSLTKFADDVTKLSLAPENSTIDEIFGTATRSMQAFDDILWEHGYAQNRDKLLAILALNGEGSRIMLRSLAGKHSKMPIKCSLSALSLGAIVTADASTQSEIQARLSAVHRAYYKRGSLWGKSGIPYRLRRLYLINDIQNAAFSGLEAFVVSSRQASQLDGAVAKVCRVAMRGNAVTRNVEARWLTA